MTRVPSVWGPRWSRWVGRFLARGIWRTRVLGREHIPSDGPVIVVANHIGLPDGPVIHGVLPRPSHFLVKSEMMNGPIGYILRPAGQISVEGSGRDALVTALKVLERGGVVGIFPEGHRGAGKADTVFGGAAYLALRSGAPVVPAAIVGTRLPGEPLSVWPGPGRRILVEFGAARELNVPADVTARARQEWASREVAQWLKEQVDITTAHAPQPLPHDDADASQGFGGALGHDTTDKG